MYPVELFRILVSRTELLTSTEESGCLVKKKRMAKKNLNLTRFMKFRWVETYGLLRLTYQICKICCPNFHVVSVLNILRLKFMALMQDFECSDRVGEP